MHSPLAALSWDLWHRHRRSILWAVGLLAFGWIFNALTGSTFKATEAGRSGLVTINSLMMAACLLLIFAIFNYTELNRGSGWNGFPYRHFTLPDKTWFLVSLPMALGFVVVELVYWSWVRLVFSADQTRFAIWHGVLIGTYLALYQAVLWVLAGFRSARVIVLGLLGASFVAVDFLPQLGRYTSTPWLTEEILVPFLFALAGAAFVIAWVAVARQRCGGGYRQHFWRTLLDRVIDSMPSRRQDFRSPAAAQFWLEWRRSGLLLPLSVGTLLVTVIGPCSWFLRKDPEMSAWILGWTLAAPFVLALPIGKGFSRPDFWTSELALTAFQAVRPLATGEMIAVKLKVAALSAALSWFMVILFLSLWLPGWGHLDSLEMPRIGFWMAYSHHYYPQYVMTALFFVASMLVTWKFLVGGLWVGLSGSTRRFVGFAIVYGTVSWLALVGWSLLVSKGAPSWLGQHINQVLTVLQWLAALAVTAKLLLAARTWRHVSTKRSLLYLAAWLGGGLCLVALALLAWAHGLLSLLLMSLFDSPPADAERLRSLLILGALMFLPLTRIGLASTALAANRHR